MYGMEITIKVLSEQLGVSKFTVSKAVNDLSLTPQKVGNRFVLSDEQAQQVTAYIRHEPLETLAEQSEDLQEPLEPAACESQQTLETTPEVHDALVKSLESHIADLQAQLAVKDSQLAAKDQQLADMTAALKASQEQQKALTGALQTQQTLTAVATQERLTAHSGSSGDVLAGSPAEDQQPVIDQPEQRKAGFWARLFGKR